MGEFKEILRELRIENNLTIKELSERCGYSKSVICYWEKGLRHPNAAAISVLAKFFNVSTDYLIGNEENVSTVRGVSLLKNTSVNSKMMIKELRMESGKSQTEVAKSLGISQQVFSTYEKESCFPDPNMLIKLARYFNVTVDYLIGNEESSPTMRGGSPETFTEEERTLIRYYRAIGKEAKNAVFATAESFFNMLPDERRAAYPY